MKRTSMIVATFLGVAMASAPAGADFPDDWERIDTHVFSVDLSHAETEFPGVRRYERIALVSRDEGVRCRLVRAEYGNGSTQGFEDRHYRQNQVQGYDLDGDARRVSMMRFRCRSLGNGPARLIVYAR